MFARENKKSENLQAPVTDFICYTKLIYYNMTTTITEPNLGLTPLNFLYIIYNL